MHKAFPSFRRWPRGTAARPSPPSWLYFFHLFLEPHHAVHVLRPETTAAAAAEASVGPSASNCPVSTLGPSARLLGTRFCPGLILGAYVQEVVRQPVSQATSHVLTHLQAVFQFLGLLRGPFVFLNERSVAAAPEELVDVYLGVGLWVERSESYTIYRMCLCACLGAWVCACMCGSGLLFFDSAVPQTLRGGL